MHKVLGPSLSEISDSLPGPVIAICFNTPQEKFAGYKYCITDYTSHILSKLVTTVL